MKRALELRGQQKVLLLKAIHGSRLPSLAREYQQLGEAIAVAYQQCQDGMPLVHGGFLTFDYEHRIRLDPLRLGSGETTGFWEHLNVQARSNTRFIMNLEQIAKTFAELNSKPQTLETVEGAAAALSKSIGFNTLGDFFAYLQSKPKVETGLKDDAFIFSVRRREAVGQLLSLIPSSKEEDAMLAAYRDPDADVGKEVEKMLGLLHSFQGPNVVPMQGTPDPGHLKDEAIFLVPQPYSINTLRAEFDAASKKAGEIMSSLDPQVKATANQAIEAIKVAFEQKRAAFVSDALNYWRTVFEMVMKKEAIIADYRNEVEKIKQVQVVEADRVVSDVLKMISALAMHLTAVALLSAEHSVLLQTVAIAKSKGSFHEEKCKADQGMVMMIRNSINAFMAKFTMQPNYDYMQTFYEIISLPKGEPVAVRKYLESKGLPPPMVEAAQTFPKRNLIKLMASWYIYGVDATN